jgi:hypothetical protein
MSLLGVTACQVLYLHVLCCQLVALFSMIYVISAFVLIYIKIFGSSVFPFCSLNIVLTWITLSFKFG